MTFPIRLFRAAAVVLPVFVLTAGPGPLARPAGADDPKPATPARPTVAILAGGADGDLKVLREDLGKVPGVKFKADDVKYADFGRDGGLFTGFFPIELTNLATTDIGAVAKAVASDGITANTVSPGTIRSATLEEAFRKAATGRGLAAEAPWADIEQKVLPMFAQVPMGRVGTLEEIADAVAFLVSPRAGYITGANLRLDGGMWPGL